MKICNYMKCKAERIIAITFIIFVMTLTVFTCTVYADSDGPVKKGVYRIYGENRYKTAFEVADALKEQLGKSQFDDVIIACGTDFADALAGSYLATVKEAPILMSDKNNAELIAYIKLNLKLDGKVYILGGPKAVPESLDKQLSDYSVVRLAGATRYETNIKILNEAEVNGDEILICTAYNFADSLSASATKKPILLVNTHTNELTIEQQNFMKSNKSSGFCIIGGISAISKKLEKEIADIVETRRLGGDDRYETSVLVAKNFIQGPKAAVLAYSNNFPDGLSGAALAHAIDAPLLLVSNGNEATAAQYTEKNNISYGVVLGGSGLISDKTTRNVFRTTDEKPINKWSDVKNYSITYVMNNGKNTTDNPSVYTSGQTITLKEPVRENYTFKGWYKEKNFKTKVEKITSEDYGNITLYAKWHLESLNINGDGMEDMIWSWWYYPQVVSERNKVFWGYSTSDGYCGVAAYDSTDKSINKTSLKKADKVDDHNGLALTLMDDKRIMCAYAGGHNSNNEIHIRISENPLDISKFNESIVLESSGKTCYSQILYSSGKYYLFYRVNNNSWAYRTSENGIEWTEELIVVKSTLQYYCRVMPTTEDGLLRILMYSNPTNSATEIRMGFLNTEDNSIYNADTKTLLENGNNSYDKFKVILDKPKSKTQRLFDVAITDPDKPMFLYTVFTSKAKINDSVYYLFDAGESYRICDGGKPLWDPKYQLGASFVNNKTIVVSRNSEDTDYIEIYKYDGKKVTYSKTLDTHSVIANSRNARPIADIKGRAIMWHNGYYNLNSYTDFLTSARMYLIEND